MRSRGRPSVWRHRILDRLDDAGEVMAKRARVRAEQPLERIPGVRSGKVARPLELDVAQEDRDQSFAVVVDHRGLREQVDRVRHPAPERVQCLDADGGIDPGVRVLRAEQVDRRHEAELGMVPIGRLEHAVIGRVAVAAGDMVDEELVDVVDEDRGRAVDLAKSRQECRLKVALGGEEPLRRQVEQLREYLERRHEPRIRDDGVERIALRARQGVGPRHLRPMVLDQRQCDRDLPDGRPEVLLVEHVGDLVTRQRRSRARTDVDHRVLRDQQIAAVLVAVPLVLDEQRLAVALGCRNNGLVLVVEVEKVFDGGRAQDLVALDRLIDVELAGVNDPWLHHRP
jgi:hypothetical protein